MMILSSSIHLPKSFMNSLFLIAEWYSIVYIYPFLSISLLKDICILCVVSSYKQSLNSDTIIDDKKCIPKGACHGCLQRGLDRDLHIQRQMLAANHWTECGVPNGRVGGWSRGAEGDYSPMGRTKMLATQMCHDSQELNHQPRGTQGSSQKCVRGMPCQASVGGEVLFMVNYQ